MGTARPEITGTVPLTETVRQETVPPEETRTSCPFPVKWRRNRRSFQKRDGENRTERGGEGRKFFGDKNEGRPGQNKDGRRDGRKPASGETLDLGMRKPGRDARKDKEREKEKGREEKMTTDRRPSSGGNRPNQGRRPNQRLPKALQKPVRPQPKQEEKKDEIKEIKLPEKMTVRELADKMKIQPSVIVKKLFMGRNHGNSQP